METWKLLLITFLSAIVLGWIVGVIIGKIKVKRMHSRRGPVVSRKEFLILAAIVLVGVGCVLYGVFFADPAVDEVDPMNPDGVVANPEGMADPGIAENPGGDVPAIEPRGDDAADAGAVVADEPLDVNNTGGEDDSAGEEEPAEDEEADEPLAEEATVEAAPAVLIDRQVG